VVAAAAAAAVAREGVSSGSLVGFQSSMAREESREESRRTSCSCPAGRGVDGIDAMAHLTLTVLIIQNVLVLLQQLWCNHYDVCGVCITMTWVRLSSFYYMVC
jgi:hypothetical protein